MGHVSNQPARHETSMGGMIGAMIVMVAVVLGFVVFRDATRETPEIQPEAIEWELAANAAIDGGHPVVRPELPEDWIVTSMFYEPTDPLTWGLGIYTADGKFAGLRQEDARVADLLETYVDDEPDEGDPVTITGEFAGEWDVWTDEGGDTGLVLQRERDVLLVYGSAPKDQLVDLASGLTTEKVEIPSRGAPTPSSDLSESPDQDSAE